jgi:ferric hydroxamate transport system ATP-binding protein
MVFLQESSLSASAVSLAHGDRTVVHDADIALRAGRVTALVGPNGSGKSTLLRALARLHRPTTGEVSLAGDTPAQSLSAREFATRVTMLAQHRPSPGGVSVRDVVGYGRFPHRARWRGTDPEGARVVDWAMAATGVTSMAARGVDALSGGELQRVWLASCLAQQTPVLLLDEPTNHLDLRYQMDILDVVRDLADTRDVAVGIVLHDLDQAAAVADDVVLMKAGRVHACGPPDDVITEDHLADVFGVAVRVGTDPATGLIHTQPLGRHSSRRAAVARPA